MYTVGGISKLRGEPYGKRRGLAAEGRYVVVKQGAYCWDMFFTTLINYR